jgi:hypothetical protein
MFEKSLKFLSRHWWWFFVPSVIWTGISGFALYAAVLFFNPKSTLMHMKWSRPPEIVAQWEPFIPILSYGFIGFVFIATFVPIALMIYLRFKRSEVIHDRHV